MVLSEIQSFGKVSKSFAIPNMRIWRLPLISMEVYVIFVVFLKISQKYFDQMTYAKPLSWSQKTTSHSQFPSLVLVGPSKALMSSISVVLIFFFEG